MSEIPTVREPVADGRDVMCWTYCVANTSKTCIASRASSATTVQARAVASYVLSLNRKK
jgi:hypothetical protein